jgi:lipopolysaccharide transport system permease protein
MSADHAAGPIVEISSKSPLFPDFVEAWRYRWMAIALARRSVMTRYTQTVLGPVWFIIQPIMLTGVLTLVMGGLLRAPSDGLPYVLFAGTGSIFWATFNRTLSDASTSLVSTGGIFSKVYFPRILVPVAAVMAAAVDFVPVYVLLIIAIAAYGLWPGWPILLFPVFFAIPMILAFAAGLWLTVLDSYFRDVRLTVPYVMQFIFYVSPIMYATSAIPEKYKILFTLNPVTGMVGAFRWSLVAGVPAPSVFEMVWVGSIGLVGLIGGLLVFARFERIVVDRI